MLPLKFCITFAPDTYPRNHDDICILTAELALCSLVQSLHGALPSPQDNLFCAEAGAVAPISRATNVNAGGIISPSPSPSARASPAAGSPRSRTRISRSG